MQNTDDTDDVPAGLSPGVDFYEDPTFTAADWRADVKRHGTRLGYAQWVHSEVAAYR